MKNIFVALVICFLFFSCTDTPHSIDPNNGKLKLVLLNAEETGIDFQNTIKENRQLNVLMYEYYHNGGGVAIGDINNDGLPDIYFTSTLFSNKLYLNKGNFKFEDITEKSGTKGEGGLSTGVTLVDINSDGLLDIYVCQSGNFDSQKRRNKLFVNQGDLTFKEDAEAYGIDDDAYSTQAYFFDIDNDNDLDLFLLNHQVITPQNNALSSSKIYDGNAGDKMFVNENGEYIDESKSYKINQNRIGYGLSATVSDFNNDGWMDVYVCNDYIEHDYFYVNNKGKSFEELSHESFKKTSFYAMGSDAGDFNNDGWQDLVVADMAAADNYRIKTNMSGMDRKAFERSVDNGFGHQYMYNSFQVNRGVDSDGDVKFSDIAQVDRLSMTDWSWAPLFLDFDNDTYLDLFVTNGLRKEARNNDFVTKKKKYLKQIQNSQNSQEQDVLIQRLLSEMPSVKLSNYLFRNIDGIGFENVSEEMGIDQHTSFSNGMAYGDLDNDGDLDLVINNIDDEAFVFKNETHNNFLKIKLKGPQSNFFGIGAKVEVKLNEDLILTREMLISRGYLSSVEPVLNFGLGSHSKIENVKVSWPDGKVEIVSNVDINKTLVINYKKNLTSPKMQFSRPSYFEKQQTPLDAIHQENKFDDYERELLLPHKMSQDGPALAIGDVNDDGLIDFYLGSSFGYNGKLYVQKEDGGFEKSMDKIWENSMAFEEVSAEFIDIDIDGDLDLYVVSGGNEKDDELAYPDQIYINDGKGNFRIDAKIKSLALSSGSCVIKNDFDKDGDDDLFVGGRQTPGRYPQSGESYLLINNGEGLLSETLELVSFKNMGMVTDATWGDYNNDGWDDLIVVGEWMPISIFLNARGKLSSEPLVIENSVGWWNCVSKGDVNNDKIDDYIFGNLGINYKYQASHEKPFNIYASDFDNNSSHDIVLSYIENNNEFPLRGRECSSNQMPFIKEKFDNYDAFGKATITEVYTEGALNASLSYKASNFKHMMLLSDKSGSHQWRPLPKTAQWFTIQSIVLLDLNKDGWLDIVSGGNLLGSEAETPRSDASYGEIFLNDKKGSFADNISNSHLDLEGQISNIKVISEKGINENRLLVSINNGPLYILNEK